MDGRKGIIAAIAGHGDRPSTGPTRTRLMTRHRLILAAILCAAGHRSAVAASGRADDPGAIAFFEKSIRPLLAEKCQKCHGDKKTQGGLSLTGRESVLKGGDSGPAAVPGKPRESLIIEAVEQQGELKMPPRGSSPRRDRAPEALDRAGHALARGARGDSKAPCAAAARSDLTRSGGPSGRSGRRPLRRSRTPRWPRTEIDRFILAALEARGLRPAPPADRRTLIRRATYDLTGLPPTPEEVEAFLADRSPDAFAKVVDRLLASPAYGERWGRHWLDVVRYADARDLIQLPAESDFREAWRYRDWVVAAFNRDMSVCGFRPIPGRRRPAADAAARRHQQGRDRRHGPAGDRRLRPRRRR